MKYLIDALTHVAIDRSGNPFGRFILKKHREDTKIKAIKKYIVEVFYHIPGKNIKCLDIQSAVNIANKDDDAILNELKPQLFYKVLKYLDSKEMEEMLNGIQVK